MKNIENLTLEKISELKNRLYKIVEKQKCNFKHGVYKDKELLDFINYMTPQLSDPFFKLGTKIFWVLKDIKYFPKCPVCGKERKFNIGAVSALKDELPLIFDPNKCCGSECSNRKPGRSEKTKQTNLIKYGVTCSLHSPENKIRVKATKEKHKQEDPNYCKKIYEKTMNTYKKRTGYDSYWDNPEYRDKINNALIKKYGSKENAYKIFRKKGMKTYYEKTGYENPFSNPEIIEKLDVKSRDWDSIVKKAQATERANHGGLLYNQTQQAAKNRSKRILFDGIWFASSWEVKIYKFCKENNMDVIYQPQISFEYIVDGITHVYFPDFLINGKIYEVKGGHFFTVDENGNETMRCPFKHKNWTEQKIKEINRRYAEKYKCMKSNNVIIIKSIKDSDLKSIFLNNL